MLATTSFTSNSPRSASGSHPVPSSQAMISSQSYPLIHTSTGVPTSEPVVAGNSTTSDPVFDDPDNDFFHHQRWYRILILFVSSDIVSTSTMLVVMAWYVYDGPLVYHTNLADLLLPNIYEFHQDSSPTDQFLVLLRFIQSWLPTNQFLSLLAFILNSLLLETMRARGVHRFIIMAMQVFNILMVGVVQQSALLLTVEDFYISTLSLLTVVCLYPVACILYWLYVEGISSSISSCR